MQEDAGGRMACVPCSKSKGHSSGRREYQRSQSACSCGILEIAISVFSKKPKTWFGFMGAYHNHWHDPGYISFCYLYASQYRNALIEQTIAKALEHIQLLAPLASWVPAGFYVPTAAVKISYHGPKQRP